MEELPKRRGGHGGGGGSGGGGGGGPGVAQLAAGPYTVQVESRTRGGLEDARVTFTGPEQAVVDSASGHSYRVTLGEAPSCECPDHVIRHRECRHIAAVRLAMGLAGVAPAATAPRPPSVPREAVAESAAEAAASRSAELAEGEEQERAWLRSHAGAENVVLSEMSSEEFEGLLAAAARRENVEYEYENALGGSQNTFGIEVEFEGGNLAAIARDLYQEGLVPLPQQQGYHASRRAGMWSFERDGSVPSGGEIVSPVMRDTPEAWRQIERVCEIVRRHGGQATAHCGMHVHVGSAPLDTSARRWYRLARIAGGYEDVLFRVAAGGSSGGVHRGTRGGGHYHYARPGLAGRVQEQPPGEPGQDAVRRLVDRVISPGGHYEAVNASGYCTRGTVEFRHFDGTLDPMQVQAYVKVANGIVQAAQRMRSGRAEAALPERGMPVGSGAARGDSEHRAVRRFLDTIFGRTRDKAHVLWLYATSRWQPAPGRVAT